MNKEDFFEALQEELSQFIVHKECETEIQNYIVGTGKEKRFLALLKTRKKQIKQLSQADIIKIEEFEILKGENGLMAMHLTSKEFNYRILFRYIENNQILLLCFEERQGKKKTEYSSFTPIAHERYANYMKGGSDR